MSYELRRVAAFALVLSACEQSDRATLADTTELSVIGTSDADAQRVGVLDGFYGPESVKYDPDQDVWFITNMLGPGSDKDSAAFIDRVDAGELKTPVRFIESGRNGATLDAPKGMAIHG